MGGEGSVCLCVYVCVSVCVCVSLCVCGGAGEGDCFKIKHGYVCVCGAGGGFFQFCIL